MKNRNICKLITETPSDKLEISGFILESDADTMRERVRLEAHRMILVVQGRGYFRFGENRVAFRPGSLVLGFRDEWFAVEFSEPCEYMYLMFRGARAEDLLRRFDICPGNRSFEGFDGVIPLWRDSLSRASEINIDLAAESILLYTFSRFRGSDTVGSSLVGEIVAITEENFTDPELSLSAIAEELGYNAKYVSHIFKQKMGIGHAEYLRTLRIKYAVSLFDHGIDSVKNVALLSGFTDPLYFSTVFKKNIGVSPKDYKNRTDRPVPEEKER